MNQQEYNSILTDYKRVCDILSEIWQVEMSILSLSRFNMLHVTPKFTALTGVTNDDLQSLHRKTFSHLIHPKELSTVTKAHSKTILFYTKLYQKEGNTFYTDAQYYMKIRNQAGEFQDFHIYLHPIYFSDAGYPILSYLLLLPGIQFGYEKYSISIKSPDKKLYYSSQANKYVPKKNLELKEVEIDILKLTSKGHGENKIAKLLDIKMDLVRYYKKSIYKKYCVTSMAEAVYIALKNRSI